MSAPHHDPTSIGVKEMENFEITRLIYLMIVLVILAPGIIYWYRRYGYQWLWDLLFWVGILVMISMVYIWLFEPDFIAPPGERWAV